MDRFQELLKQGKLLFVGKIYPKYMANNKIRVFKPSSVLRVTLLFTTLYAATRYSYHKKQTHTGAKPQRSDNKLPR